MARYNAAHGGPKATAFEADIRGMVSVGDMLRPYGKIENKVAEIMRDENPQHLAFKYVGGYRYIKLIKSWSDAPPPTTK